VEFVLVDLQCLSQRIVELAERPVRVTRRITDAEIDRGLVVAFSLEPADLRVHTEVDAVLAKRLHGDLALTGEGDVAEFPGEIPREPRSDPPFRGRIGDTLIRLPARNRRDKGRLRKEGFLVLLAILRGAVEQPPALLAVGVVGDGAPLPERADRIEAVL